MQREGDLRMRYAWLLVVAHALCGHVTSVLATCPHQEAGLRRWSDQAGWQALGKTKPGPAASVTITDPVLLDESTPGLGGIEIQAGGKLVFSPEHDVTFTAVYINVHGELHVGSENCPFTGQARIVLDASRNQYNIPWYGEKFIVVKAGGKLELHGKQKLSWTKLDTTMPKLTLNNGGLIYDAMKQVDSWNRGLVWAVLDGSTGAVRDRGMTYIVGTNTWRLTNDPIAFYAAMNNVVDGDVVAIAVQKDFIGDGTRDLTPFHDAIETAVYGAVTMGLKLRILQAQQAWTLLAVRGQWVEEKLESVMGDDGQIKARLMAALPGLDRAVLVESHLKPDNVMRGAGFLKVATMDKAAKKVDLASDATTWVAGDRVLVTSTDFDWRQAEEAEIVHCPPSECASNQVRLLLFPVYEHFGDVSEGVDMRAEVALLSRHVTIEGKMAAACTATNGNCNVYKHDTYGGYISVDRGFASARIAGVELRHLGQATDANRHALYFPMLGDVANSPTPTPAYVKHVSITDSFSMCVALKATSGLTVSDSVAWRHLGHCFALLEGGEKNNVFDGNLGAGTVDTARNDAERHSATFFITNPLTELKNNVAAGSNMRGIWYTFPRQPIGDSASLGLMAQDEARHTPLSLFTNNAAHSNKDYGLVIENELKEGHTLSGNIQYKPRVDPLDPDSDAKEVVIDRFTGFKNRYQNAYVRGGRITVTHASLADAARGIWFGTSSDDLKVLEKSVVVGESANLGEPYMKWNNAINGYFAFPRSIPLPWEIGHPIQGFTFYGGPVEVANTWFSGFQDNENRSSSALGFYLSTPWPSNQNNKVTQLQFGFDDPKSNITCSVAEGNRFFEAGDESYKFGSNAGDLESILYDVDGSLTGHVGSTLVKPFPVFTTPQCYTRGSWGMAVCPHHYAKIKIETSDANQLRSSPILTHDDLAADQGLQSPNEGYVQYPVITGGDYSYILHWTEFFPAVLHIFGKGIVQGESVRVGLCVPRDAVLDLYTYEPTWAPRIDLWTEVTSLTELDADETGDKYFWDRANGLLFVKLLSHGTPAEGSGKECDGNCPMVRVKLTGGTRTDADCRERMDQYARTTPSFSSAPLTQVALPATSPTPPEGLGAGEFFPFQTREVRDGGYGPWTNWGSCSVTCGGGIQYRTRACDSPMPQNGGQPCLGESEQDRECGSNPCEIHGNFSAWTTWSACLPLTGNGNVHGFHRRTRGCDDPAPRYNGDVCLGDTREMAACVIAA